MPKHFNGEKMNEKVKNIILDIANIWVDNGGTSVSFLYNVNDINNMIEMKNKEKKEKQLSREEELFNEIKKAVLSGDSVEEKKAIEMIENFVTEIKDDCLNDYLWSCQERFWGD